MWELGVIFLEDSFHYEVYLTFSRRETIHKHSLPVRKSRARIKARVPLSETRPNQTRPN